MRLGAGIGIPFVLAAGLLAAPDVRATETVLDAFESSVSKWTFSNGMEFPGATGSLASGAGRTGNGAVLAYDLSGGGHHVAATVSLRRRFE